MKANEDVNILLFTCDFRQNANARKLSRSLPFKAHNLKTMYSGCNLKTDLERAKAEEYSSDVIFASPAKLFN